MAAFETIIGLEVHAQLLTETKLFCGCLNQYGAEPNTQVCAVCAGLPGALPVLNRSAVQLALKAAIALGCEVQLESQFARKQYFYPDSPKGYQITQHLFPYCKNGRLRIESGGAVKEIGITRIHMEEDAGKSVHGAAGGSLIDLNRAGTPLIEIVSEPELRSSAEAVAYLKELRNILIFIGVNNGNLEQGSFRCDANVSLRPAGSAELGTRTELKNINSFRFVQRAIDEEVARQSAILSSGGKVEQQTRGFDPETGRTHTLRSKENSHDYRYFAEPDLPDLVLSEELVNGVRAALPELPEQLRERWVSSFGLSEQAASTLSSHPAYAAFFNQVVALFPQPVKAANWVLTEVLRSATQQGVQAEFSVTPEQVAELLDLVEQGVISGKQAKRVHAELEGLSISPREIVDKLGMRLVSDAGAVGALVAQVLVAYPAEVAQYRAGKIGLRGFFVGQVMKAGKGQADPKQVNAQLDNQLGAPAPE